MQRIETQEQLEEALSSTRAVIFIGASWSHTAKHSEFVFANWLSEWNCEQESLTAYSVELDDHEFALNWLANREACEADMFFGEGASYRKGNGALVWIKNGKIAGWETAIFSLGMPELQQRAVAIYAR